MRRATWLRDNIDSLSGFSANCSERTVWGEVYLSLLTKANMKKTFEEEWLRVYQTKLRNQRIQERKDEQLRLGWNDKMIEQIQQDDE